LREQIAADGRFVFGSIEASQITISAQANPAKEASVSVAVLARSPLAFWVSEACRQRSHAHKMTPNFSHLLLAIATSVH
jgi:hypothetical protein